MKVDQSAWIFFRSISTMVSAGIPLHQGLASLADQKGVGRLAEVADQMVLDLTSGRRFAEAMRRHPNHFSTFHWTLVNIGENTGGLDVILDRLAEYEERVVAIEQLLISRLTYPAILLVCALTMLFFLPAFALEGLFQVIENADTELPLLTTLFIGLSRLLREPIVLLFLLLGLGVSVVAGKRGLTSTTNRQVLYRLAVKLPGLGPVLQTSSLAIFAEALALQLRVGVPPLQALSSGAAVASNPILIEEAAVAVESIKNGASFSESLAQAESLTVLFKSMLSVGEQSGKLPELMKRIGSFYQEQVEYSLEALASLLEPAIMVLMGCMFALMLVATMLPLVKLVETL